MCNSGLVEEMRVYIGVRDGNCQKRTVESSANVRLTVDQASYWWQ